MSEHEHLEARIDSLRKEIAASKGAARKDLMEHLEQAAMGLESAGGTVPAWVQEVLEAMHEDEAEDGFDNMPL
ncbi:hypothetical protein [Antarctobacter sp.]|uniref:hypothetical protein n=1 Tax=Antarctobacter sp. TaxID=1872577 RepID=UPI002B2760AD|nr:hypothetical protein [Antarctobacter sp.]